MPIILRVIPALLLGIGAISIARGVFAFDVVHWGEVFGGVGLSFCGILLFLGFYFVARKAQKPKKSRVNIAPLFPEAFVEKAIRPVLFTETTNEMGLSNWIGGAPKLGQAEWPLSKDGQNAMMFLAQVSLQNLKPALKTSTTHSTGSLAFFIDPADIESGEVVFVAAPQTERPSVPPKPAKCPEGLLSYNSDEIPFPYLAIKLIESEDAPESRQVELKQEVPNRVKGFHVFGEGTDLNGFIVAKNRDKHLLLLFNFYECELTRKLPSCSNMFQFWITPEDLRRGNWGAATMTFECD